MNLRQDWWFIPVISASQEVEIRTIMVQDQSGQNMVARPHFNQYNNNKKLGVAVCVCHPSYVVNVNRKIAVHALPGINARSYLKNN
jgi:hypothetical protein